MATIIWCDKVRHIVEESRDEVMRRIGSSKNVAPVELRSGFSFFTPVDTGAQRALNVDLISSVEAMPGDPV